MFMYLQPESNSSVSLAPVVYRSPDSSVYSKSSPKINNRLILLNGDLIFQRGTNILSSGPTNDTLNTV